MPVWLTLLSPLIAAVMLCVAAVLKVRPKVPTPFVIVIGLVAMVAALSLLVIVAVPEYVVTVFPLPSSTVTVPMCAVPTYTGDGYPLTTTCVATTTGALLVKLKLTDGADPAETVTR